MKTLILAAVAAVTLGAAAAPAMAQPGYWHHGGGWRHWHRGYYGPGPGYWHHRHWCRWHPYRCGW
jgi:Spy/CpxP family protein refolding chaperone